MSRIPIPAVHSCSGASAEASLGARRAAKPTGTAMLRCGRRIMTIAGRAIAAMAGHARLRREAEALSRLNDHTLRDIRLDRVATLYGIRFRHPPAEDLP